MLQIGVRIFLVRSWILVTLVFAERLLSLLIGFEILLVRMVFFCAYVCVCSGFKFMVFILIILLSLAVCEAIVGLCLLVRSSRL